MPKNYRISRRAYIDLDEIWLFTFKNWSRDQANHYQSLLQEEIEKIAKNPDRGEPYGDIRRGFRRKRMTSHYIFYRVLENQFVEIARILYVRMDFEERLNE